MSIYAYGIDFGTTNSTVTAINTRGRVLRLEIDTNSFDKAVMRSMIYIDHNIHFRFGQEAVNKYINDIAEGKVSRRKRIYTGRKIRIAAPAKKVSGFQPDIWVPEIVEVEEGEGGRLIQALKSALAAKYIQDFFVFDEKFTIVELIASYLREIKRQADQIVGEDVKDVVLGRPVNYIGFDNELAVNRMITAAKIAGFENIKFEFEPIGAAYDYGIDIKDQQTALMFDFGGGTLDINIMRFPDKKVLANTGVGLGGDFFNSEIFMKKIAKYFGSEETYGDQDMRVPGTIYNQLRNWYSISLMKSESFEKILDEINYKHSDPKKLDALKSLVYNNLGFKLYEEIENAKKELTDKLETEIKLQAEDININEKFTRQEFEEIISKELITVEKTIDDALNEAGLEAKDIDNVATTGGSSLIPVVQNLIKNKFGEEKIKSTDAFTSVSTGLAVRAKEEFFD